MPRINKGRLVAGGVVAGVVLNVAGAAGGLVWGEGFQDALRSANLADPGGGAMLVLLALTIVVGIAAVWLYAAIRTRFKPGPPTAALAGVVVWLLNYAVPGASMAAFGFFPVGLTVVWAAWNLVAMVAATLAGAWVYREVADTPAGVSTGAPG